MFTRVLSWLFPPVLPGKVRDWEERAVVEQPEQGWAGNVKRRYRDGIERYFAENPPRSLYGGTNHQWQIQLRAGAEITAALEKELIAQGYVNTIHDCWEKEST